MFAAYDGRHVSMFSKYQPRTGPTRGTEGLDERKKDEERETRVYGLGSGGVAEAPLAPGGEGRMVD